jgi:hypothetical protein
MESTWEPRDLPILDAIVRYFDEHDDPHIPNERTFAEITGRDVQEVHQAVRALAPSYLVIQRGGMSGDPGDASMIMGVTDAAREKVGQWPTPEGIVDRLVQGLLDAADQEPDEQKKSRLRSVAEGLGGFARDVAVGVISSVATKPLGM